MLVSSFARLNASVRRLVLASLLFAPSLASAQLPSLDAYNTQFYKTSGSNGYYSNDVYGGTPDRSRFWQSAETMEVLLDGYQRTRSAQYKSLIKPLTLGFNNLVSGTSDWASWNKFNDDLQWATIAFTRSYLATGDLAMLDQAKSQFNAMWTRGWDSTLGGGIYWTTDKHEKNTASNAPAGIAAMLLYQATGDASYKDKAKQIFNWLSTHLYESNGRLIDHVNLDGSLDYGAYTYNQGTFSGLATLLYQDSGDANYLKYAKDATHWAKANLTGQHTPGILNDEYGPDGGWGDGVGFKGIFARWGSLYARVSGDQEIRNWLTENAQSAWGYRNSKDLMWAQYWRRTPDYLTSWEASSPLSANVNAVPEVSPLAIFGVGLLMTLAQVRRARKGAAACG